MSKTPKNDLNMNGGVGIIKIAHHLVQASFGLIFVTRRGLCSGVRAAVAGQTRLKVVHKSQKNFTVQISNLRAKERTQVSS